MRVGLVGTSSICKDCLAAGRAAFAPDSGDEVENYGSTARCGARQSIADGSQGHDWRTARGRTWHVRGWRIARRTVP